MKLLFFRQTFMFLRKKGEGADLNSPAENAKKNGRGRESKVIGFISHALSCANVWKLWRAKLRLSDHSHSGFGGRACQEAENQRKARFSAYRSLREPESLYFFPPLTEWSGIGNDIEKNRKMQIFSIAQHSKTKEEDPLGGSCYSRES